MPHVRGHLVSPNFAALMRGRAEPVARGGAQPFIPGGPGAQPGFVDQPAQEFLPGSPTNPALPGTQFQAGVPAQAGQPPLVPLQPGPPPLVRNQAFQDRLGELIALSQGQQAPPTGLIGGEQALRQGTGAGIAALEEGFGRAGGAIQQGTAQALGLVGQGQQAIQGGTAQALGLIGEAQQPLQPFQQGGTQAQQLQLAQSGAFGPEAQQAAFDAFTASPGQEFLRREGQRNLTRNAAALGGIGGGNVRRALVQQGVGFAAQDFGNQFNRLAQLSGQGLTAAGGIAQLGGQGAGLAQQGALARGQLGGLGGGFAQQAGLARGGLLGQAGQQAAGIFQQAGRDIAQERFQTGRDIASAVQGTTSALSDLAAQQGAGLAGVTEQGGVNIANILAGAGQLDAAGQQALATILANLATQQGTQVAGLQEAIGEARAEGIVGQAAGQRAGVEAVAAAFTSDPSLKENIVKIGETIGLNIYTWTWKAFVDLLDPRVGEPVGFMADEVQALYPEAVTVEDGIMLVNYSLLKDVHNG